MGSLGDGRDVDEEIRLEEMEDAVREEPELEVLAPVTEGSSFIKGAVIGKAPEENLSNFVLSWTLVDVLNKDLLKEKRSRPEHNHSGRDLYNHSNECEVHGKLKRKQGETDEQESHVRRKPRFNWENSAHIFHYMERCLCSECHRDYRATETHSLMEGEARHGLTTTKNSQYTPSTGELPMSQQADIQTNNRSIPKVPSPTRNRGCHNWFSEYPDTNFGRKQGNGTTQPQWSRTGSDIETQRESSTRDISCSRPTQSYGYRGMHHQGEPCYRREDSTRDINSSRPTQSPGLCGMHHQGESWYRNFYVDDQNRMCGRVKPQGKSSFNLNNQSHYERPPPQSHYERPPPQDVWDGPRNVRGNTSQRPGDAQSPGPRGMHHQGEPWYRNFYVDDHNRMCRKVKPQGRSSFNLNNQSHYERPPQGVWDGPRNVRGNTSPHGGFRRTQRSINRDRQLSFTRNQKVSRLEQVIGHEGSKDSSSWGKWPECGKHGVIRHKQSVGSWGEWPDSGKQGVIGHEESLASSSWGEWPECGKHGVIRHKQSVGSWGEWPDSGKQGVIGHEESLASSSRWEWPASGKQGVIGQVSSSQGGWSENVKHEMIGQEKSEVPSSWGGWPENLKQEVIGQEEYVVSSLWGGWPENLKQEVIRQEESIVCSSRGGWPENLKQEVIGQEESIVCSSRGRWPENVKQEVIGQEESIVSSSHGGWPENVKLEVIGQDESLVSSSWGEWPESVKQGDMSS